MRAKKGEAKRSLDAVGIDAVCELFRDGMSYAQAAATLGHPKMTLVNWIESDPVRSARAKEAKAASAKEWDARAEHELRSAVTPFELARAKELAHHYRWRAKCYAPKEYGDRVQAEHSGPDGSAVPVEVKVVFGRG